MTEAELCADLIAEATKREKWKAYPETAGFDILLVRVIDGLQIGVEAKLQLNAKVITQALPHISRWYTAEEGPEHRAVLVPFKKVQAGFSEICDHLGLTVIQMFDRERFVSSYSDRFSPSLPNDYGSGNWHHWCPSRRCKLPDFVPDVQAGVPSPMKLSEWKIKAIRLAVILETRPVTRTDFKKIGLSPSIWTDRYNGWLEATPSGYVPRSHMPDFRKQHPENFEQIKAAAPVWMKAMGLSEEPVQAMKQGELI